ncbi:MAG: V-type ATP synthase subunit E [Acetanaerobacterium sp.]
MTGLEKIIKRIEDEANAEAAEAVRKTTASAQALVDAAVAAAERESQKTVVQAHAQAKDILTNARSAAQLAKRQAMLAEKQRLISAAIDDAQKALLGLPDKDYFDLIERLVGKNLLKASGEIFFSQTDLDRLPAGYAFTLSVAATAKGGVISLGKTPRDIGGGFVLVYHDEGADGDIEINCSFEALFYSAREALQDKVSTLLFS